MGSHEFSHSRGKVTSIVERISEHRGNNDACSESPACLLYTSDAADEL